MRCPVQRGKFTTPYGGASDWVETTKGCRTTMDKTMAQIRPAELYRQIQDLAAQLERMALVKAPAPVKPWVNRAFNS